MKRLGRVLVASLATALLSAGLISSGAHARGITDTSVTQSSAFQEAGLRKQYADATRASCDADLAYKNAWAKADQLWNNWGNAKTREEKAAAHAAWKKAEQAAIDASYKKAAAVDAVTKAGDALTGFYTSHGKSSGEASKMVNDLWKKTTAQWNSEHAPKEGGPGKKLGKGGSVAPHQKSLLKSAANAKQDVMAKMGEKKPGLKDLLNAKLAKDQVHRIDGKDAPKVKIGNQRDGSTPVIRIDPKVATHLKVATLPNPLPKPAVDQVKMIPPPGGKSANTAINPQPIPLPQPAVGQAKVQKASHAVATLPNPLPRPVNTAALGRR